MRSMLVIGLGRFGTHLATRLAELGNDVMVIDKNEAAAEKLADVVTSVQIGDCMDIDILRSLGVSNFDICFVCISENFQSSLEITSLLKELGAPYVISKTDRDIHAKFLKKIGADEVIYPERDMARRAAVRYSANNTLDYIELTPEYAIFEMLVPPEWAGRTVSELGVRSKHNINIIGIKKNDKIIPMTDPQQRLYNNEHLLVAGSRNDILRLLNKR